MEHEQLAGYQFDMPGLFDYTVLSVPLTLEHQTGGWSVNWKCCKKKTSMAYAQLSFCLFNGVTQENYNKFKSE